MDLLFAYIDPGTGSLLIQALIAALVAIPIFFRQRIARVIRLVRGKSEASADPGPEPEDDTTSQG